MPTVIPQTIDGHNINDGTNYHAVQTISTGLPTLQPNFINRDGVSSLLGQLSFPERFLPVLEIEILNSSNLDALVLQLHQWFDFKDQTSKRYVTSVGGVQRYMDVVCVGLKQKDGVSTAVYQAFLVADGFSDRNYRFRGVTPNAPTNWNITASPSTRAFTVTGHDEAYPKIVLTPTTGVTGGYSFKRWIPVRWRASAAATKYPVDITNDSFNTQSLIPSKMQADGDDLRVQVNGVEVDRWLDGINTTTTKTWINLDFQPKVELTITAAIASSGAVSTIDFNQSINSLPDSGILMIDSEAFTYTSKNNSLKRVLGVSRAARGTTAASHSAGATAWWVQHDIWILYGNASAAAPTVNDNNKPAFNLATSTNTSWDYDDFGEDDGLRSASWSKVQSFNGVFYTANRGTNGNPWSEMGLQGTSMSWLAAWQMINPCGIVSANFQNGEQNQSFFSFPAAIIRSSVDGSLWLDNYTVPLPSTPSTWESWSQNVTLSAGAAYVQMQCKNYMGYIEVADVTLALNSSYTPTITIVTEQGNYSLDALIENLATGDSIRVVFAMDLNQSLTIDTDLKTVIYDKDGSNQFKSVELVGGPRQGWLPLQPGSNTLRYTQVGTGTIVFDIEWEERHYY